MSVHYLVLRADASMAELLKVLLWVTICVSMAISRILMPVLFLNIRLVLERNIRGVSRKLRGGCLITGTR